MKTEFNFHNSAALLVVRAAEESGLLHEIALVLHFDNTKTSDGLGCLACEMLEQLVEAFDERICLPPCVVESFYGEGTAIHEASAVELAPYLAISAELKI